MYEVCCITDKGNYRDNNEDNFLIGKYISTKDEVYTDKIEEPFIAAVCDGVGGNSYGEIASKICLEQLLANKEKIKCKDISNTISDISNYIIQIGIDKTEYRGMSTTLCGVYIEKDIINIFNVGDSRVYILKNKYLCQLSKDHTIVDCLYEIGKISIEDRQNHRGKHIILQSVGGPKSELNPYIGQRRNTMNSDSLMMLCSDGISDFLDCDKMEFIINKYNNLVDIARNLVEEAKRNKSKDNITVVLIKNIGGITK